MSRPPTFEDLEALRREVTEFLAAEDFEPQADSWMRGFDRDFSKRVAARGWLGMAVPSELGGHGRTYLERFVVTEELLRAGAPIAAHWIADRQIAPVLVASAGRRQQEELLPGICAGEITFCVGISEPEAGSDVAAIKTRARPDGDEWVIDGQKVWTTGAMVADYCYLIARTERVEGKPHQGLSEFIVPMDSPGITVRPITDLSGEAHFTEIFLDEVRLDGWRLVGEPGQSFRQVIKQLDFERSGPERFLSSYPLFEEAVFGEPAVGSPEEVGGFAARLFGCRSMSAELARMMDGEDPPSGYAALIKDLGNQLEQDVVEWVEDSLGSAGRRVADGPGDRAAMLAESVAAAPAFTLRGGAREVLRDVVSRRMLKLERVR